VEILTSQLICAERKYLQIRKFDDFRRNWPYTKSRQNSEKREMVNWFTMVLFDLKIRLQDHWVTFQLVIIQHKLLQINQFQDFGRNRSYTKSRQNSKKKGGAGHQSLFHREVL
jgi:hypothetical protein